MITISQLFVCLPSLELTTLGQQVCSTKTGYAMHFHWGQTAAKKGTWLLWTVHINQKSSVTLTVVGKNESRAVFYIVSSESCKYKRFVWRWNKVEKKMYSRKRTKSIPLLESEHGFCQKKKDQNVAKYSNGIQMKKWWWSPFIWMVDIVLQFVWVLYRIKKDEGDESLTLLDVGSLRCCQYKVDYPRAMQNSKYPIRYLLCFNLSAK